MSLKRSIFFLFLLALTVEAQGQYYGWGRSPQSIRWNSIEASSGRIIFPTYFGARAAEVATYMNAINPHITYGLRHKPIKLPIILHSQTFNSNGIVMWMPKRMELEAIPSIETYAEPWLKQLTTHEYRHAAQYGNLYRGLMKPLGWLVGQHAAIVSTGLAPLWLLEGDAVQAETQMSSFGRALQPSFTIEYRAYMAEGKGDNYPVDKWFCGSFKDYIPNHYQFGYQLTAFGRDYYGEEIWGNMLHHASQRPYTILAIKFGLKRQYNTTVESIARRTMGDLKSFWDSIPDGGNSSEIIETPTNGFTKYSAPMVLNDSIVLALKWDMGRPERLVSVDTRSLAERHLIDLGKVATPPVLDNGVIYWSEYRNSTIWDQRIWVRACSYDVERDRRGVVRQRKRAMFPTPMPDGSLITLGYDYDGSDFAPTINHVAAPVAEESVTASTTLYEEEREQRDRQPLFEGIAVQTQSERRPNGGYYYLESEAGRLVNFPDSISVHGLCFDSTTQTIAFIGLCDGGMYIGRVGWESGEPSLRFITRPGRTTVANLRAGGGYLTFNSIASGKDEVHIIELVKGGEHRITYSRFGSVSPSSMTDNGEVYVTTFTSAGYLLARQRVDTEYKEEIPYSYLPQNIVNPPHQSWGVPLIDNVAPRPIDSGTEVKRFRKGLNLFNLHSWMPLSFSPLDIAEESRLDFSVGATVMSQDLLTSTIGYLTYGYSGKYGSFTKGTLRYNGLAPKLEASFDWGKGDQLVYGLPKDVDKPIGLRSNFQLTARAYLPLTLASGHRHRVLTPSVEVGHLNALLYNKESKFFDKGYERVLAYLSYTDQSRMGVRDLLPRWGYALKASFVDAPMQRNFGEIYSIYGRAYLPGLAKHNSLIVKANYQYQRRGEYNFNHKEVYPRGAKYELAATRYSAFSAEYLLPVWYPDFGLSGYVFIKRVNLSGYFDFARFKDISSVDIPIGFMRNVSSFGGTVSVDFHILRIPVNYATFGVNVYKPSDSKGVVVGVSFALPL